MSTDDCQAHTPRDHAPAEALLGPLKARIGGRTPVFFLDFDGTLAPIAPRPESARLPETTRGLLRSLSARYVVCVVSGRGLEDVQEKIGLHSLFYAADHGRCIVGPPGSEVRLEVGSEARSALRTVGRRLESALGTIQGVVVEQKDLSLSVHYRLVSPALHEHVAAVVGELAALVPQLALKSGKLVHELRPDDHWDKGQAVLWLLERLGLTSAEHCPVCVGDDLTDEDMFRAVGEQGVTVFVGDSITCTEALFRVHDVREAARLLAAFATPSDRLGDLSQD